MNSQKIVDTVLGATPDGISRADVARATGLSKPTVSALVGDLEAAGLVRMAVPALPSGGIGRPAALYEIVPDSSLVAGVEIGARKIIVGIAGLLGRPLAEETMDTPPDATAAADAVVASVSRLLDIHSGWRDRLRGAGIGVPGVYRSSTDSVEMAVSLPGFEDLNIRAYLSERLGVTVEVDNDVNLAALGEADAGAGNTDFVAVFVGAGIGAGLIVRGEVYRGSAGAAGELGSLILPWAGTSLERQGPATLEDVASSPAIGRIFAGAVGDGRSSTLDVDADVTDIFAAAAAGDDAAGYALSQAAAAMAHAVTHLYIIADPALIVFSGEVGANPVFLDAVADELNKLLPHPPGLARSTLGGRATFRGAISLARGALHDSLVERLVGKRAIPGDAPLSYVTSGYGR